MSKPDALAATLDKLYDNRSDLSKTIATEIPHLVEWLRTTLRQSGRTGYVIGLSGGIDSAVVAALAQQAAPGQVTLLSLPYGRRTSSLFYASSKESVNDATLLAEHLGLPLEVLDIASVVDAEATATGLASDLRTDPTNHRLATCLGNIKARARALRLRYFANRLDALLLGTENMTEHWLGYFTIGGDEESDLEVLSNYSKTEVRALARALNLPEAIQTKSPSADLWSGQTDEGELGFSYPEADIVLSDYNWSTPHPEAIARAARHGVTPAVASRVIERVNRTSFKRAPKPHYPRD